MVIADAYAACERDAQVHYENFPVASMLLPVAMRPHVAAIYAFARAADDFADEGDRSVAERYVLLDGWQRRLHHAAETGMPGGPPRDGEPGHAAEVFVALAATIRSLDLPLVLFDDLLSAFRQDVAVARYATWVDVLEYCRRSANPIGRLVLRIAGYRDAALDKWSDAICTALQLTNFWQDLESDFRRGRIYLPETEMRTWNAAESDLAAGRLTAGWRRALSEAGARTRTLFDAGRPLCDAVAGRLRYELRATWLGGTRILDLLEQCDYDVLRHRPRLRVRDVAWCAFRTIAWPRRDPITR